MGAKCQLDFSTETPQCITGPAPPTDAPTDVPSGTPSATPSSSPTRCSSCEEGCECTANCSVGTGQSCCTHGDGTCECQEFDEIQSFSCIDSSYVKAGVQCGGGPFPSSLSCPNVCTYTGSQCISDICTGCEDIGCACLEDCAEYGDFCCRMDCAEGCTLTNLAVVEGTCNAVTNRIDSIIVADECLNGFQCDDFYCSLEPSGTSCIEVGLG